MGIAMVPSDWVKEAKKNARLLVFLGALEMIVGLLAVASPAVAAMWVSIIVGTVLILSGAGHLIGAFKAGSFGAGLFGFLGGALSAAAGLLMFFRPLLGVATLSLLLALYLLVDGVSGMVLGLRIRPANGWGWLVASSGLAVVLAFLIYRQWPLAGVWAIGTFIGLHILFRGWSLVAIGLAARRGLTVVEKA